MIDSTNQVLKFLLQAALTDLVEMKRKAQGLTDMINDLADYFCEDEKTFKVEECMKIFAALINRLQIAIVVSKKCSFFFLKINCLNFECFPNNRYPLLK